MKAGDKVLVLNSAFGLLTIYAEATYVSKTKDGYHVVDHWNGARQFYTIVVLDTASNRSRLDLFKQRWDAWKKDEPNAYQLLNELEK